MCVMTRGVFVALLALAAHSVTRAALAQGLTEADVIRLASSRDPDAAVARAETREAEAREVEASIYPNPTLAWQREHVPTAAGGSEDAFVVGVPIDVSGRWSTRASLARSETRAASSRELRSRSSATLRALETYYAALGADARVDVERRKVERLRELVRVLGRRQEEGTASGYDVVRLELELEV